MEELLNKLIEKGWRPFGFIVYNVRKGPYDSRYFFFENCADGKTLRQLVSKESLLWQFVCENGMIKLGGKEKKWLTPGRLRVFDGEYQYRLIESALIDESELEDFLLDNIKV